MLYQSDNSLDSDLLKVEEGRNLIFPPHLHSSFELITVTEGEMLVTVDGERFSLVPGKAVLVFPNQLHALHTERESCHAICIFSEQLVRAYSGVYTEKLPVSNLFEPEPSLVQHLLSLRESRHLLEIKGALYSLCGAFDAQAVYRERERKKDYLLLDIFQFVADHYKESCSLQELAAHMSYHSVYLSRYFKQRTGLAFTAYINIYRVNEAAYMLKSTQKKILDVAYKCGFDSLRSFNRNFKRLRGVSPNEYRRL